MSIRAGEPGPAPRRRGRERGGPGRRTGGDGSLGAMERAVLVLREQEIRRLLDPASCLKAVEEAFTAYATGGASLPAVINLDVEEHKGEIHIKAGHLRHGSHYAVKIASGFQDRKSVV